MMNKSALLHRAKEIVGAAYAADLDRTDQIVRAIVGRAVFVWYKLTVSQLQELCEALS